MLRLCVSMCDEYACVPQDLNRAFKERDALAKEVMQKKAVGADSRELEKQLELVKRKLADVKI